MSTLDHYGKLFEEVRIAVKEQGELEFNFETFNMVCDLMLEEILNGNDDITAAEVLNVQKMKECA